MLDFEQSLKDERIFLTGHTGFTGTWASAWLSEVGIEFTGYSLAPETSPNMFTETGFADRHIGQIADIMDRDTLQTAIDQFQPTLILHLAAQPLVRKSYAEPVETFAVNALGTAHVLDAARSCKSVRAYSASQPTKYTEMKSGVGRIGRTMPSAEKTRIARQNLLPR